LSPLRVLHVIPAIAPRYGGPSRAVFAMCRALRRAGVDVEVAATDADGPHRLERPVEAEAPAPAVPVRLFARQWSEAFKYSRPLASWLDGHVREFDVVHVHAVFSHASLAAARACRRQGVPYVVRPLGSLDPWSLTRGRLGKRLLWHAGVARMLRAAAAIHYTTAEERRLAEAALHLGRGAVVTLGVDDELFEPLSTSGEPVGSDLTPAEPPYALFLGRLHPKKGLELLLAAFAALSPADRGRWRLVVAGDGEPSYVARVRETAAHLEPTGRIDFRGWLDGGERLAVLRQASLFVLPSFQENFGLGVAEALAAGVPVVVSDRVNLAPLIARAGAGWIVPPEAGALQAALAAALAAPCERATRGRAGTRLARERFSWDEAARQLAALYREVGARRARGAA
jgi:glycosyltransferase involved in cell wall biosynthesis